MNAHGGTLMGVRTPLGPKTGLQENHIIPGECFENIIIIGLGPRPGGYGVLPYPHERTPLPYPSEIAKESHGNYTNGEAAQ